ncbi:hypothetical protein KXR83_25530 [Williamsia muralis]|uniref:ComEC/Rec2 family competence protein n=1 Tax=Williamsia marianensis TaxID=85044 RepID=UPI003F179035
MGFEIDLLPVGNESKGGDAIALRYGNLDGHRDEQTVIVIDGGYQDDGAALVEHLDRYYDTNHVDLVVSTHPDRDHIAGLSTVLTELSVGALLMHVPERHDPFFGHQSSFEQKTAAVGETFAKSLTQAEDLYDLAQRRGIEVLEPFADTLPTPIDGFRILGPTWSYYETLLDEMRGRDVLAGSLSAREMALKTAKGPIGTSHEDLHTEILSEQSETSASNNSSVISMLEIDGRRILFTGDAGDEALRPVVDRLVQDGIAPGGLTFVQVPHHGSRKNVTPTLLDDLLGDITSTQRGHAYASVPLKNPEHRHPAKQTLNAFRRRGFPVISTAGSTKRFFHGAPDRGWSKTTALPLYDQVERFAD